jgi:hypothetical protein
VQRPTLALLHNLELHQSLESINLLKQASTQSCQLLLSQICQKKKKKSKKKPGIDEKDAPGTHTNEGVKLPNAVAKL